MDPKLSNLDPRLQDAYKRVMNDPGANQQPQQGQPSTDAPPKVPPPPADPAPGITPLSQFGGNNPNQSQNQTPNQDPAAFAPPMPDSAPVQPETPAPPPAPPEVNLRNLPPEDSVPIDASSPPMPSSSSTVAFNAANSSKNVGTTPVKKGGLHAVPILVGLGVIILLVVYTFVWILIFNVQIPFLPQI